MKNVKKITLFISIVACLLLSLCFVTMAAEKKPDVSVDTFSVKNVDAGIKLVWSKVKNAQGYKLYRSYGKTSNELIATVEGSQKTFTDKTAVAGERYLYKVKPYSKSFNGKSKKATKIYRIGTPDITEIKNTNTGVSLTWKKVVGAEKYSIYRKQKNDKKWTKIKTLSALNYSDSQVKSGNKYMYRIKAIKGDDYSAPVIDDIIYLSSPVVTSVMNKADSIEIKWKKVKGATEYIILRKIPGKKWTTLASVKGTASSYKDLTAKKNVKYRYTVKAKASGVKSGCFTDKYCIRLLPVGFSSVRNTSTGVELKWNKIETTSGYIIYRSTNDSATKTRIAVINNKNILSYIDRTAANGVKYTYYLLQYSGSSFSMAYNGKTVIFVSAPKELKVKRSSSNSVLSWQKVNGAKNYDIYRKAGTGGQWVKLVTTGDQNIYTDNKIEKNGVYFYSIRAINSGKYYSAFSAIVRSTRIDPSKKMIALTYDDGPAGDSTKRILDVLEKYDARATFFVLGSRIPSYYKNLQRAAALDCEIANHTYSHINLPSYSNSSILNEVNKTNELVKKYTGKTPTLIRAPGGSTNQRVRNCVNMPFIYWSIDTRDWEHRSASKTVSSIQRNARDGSIVLMHDIHTPTATASETIIPWLINQGYQLVTVSELMEYRGIKMKAGTTYYNAYK